MKKGLLFGTAVFLLSVCTAGCQDMSVEELMVTLAPMEEKLSEALEEMESAIDDFMPSITPVSVEMLPPESEAMKGAVEKLTGEPTNIPKPTNTPKPTLSSTPKPNPATCVHVYEVTEIITAATDYDPGLRRYACKQCGYETERSYALPHSVDIGNGQTATVYGYWDLEQSAEMLRLLNEWRVENGISEVKDGNNGTARKRALECAYDYSHTRPNGERCFSAFEAYGMFAMAENIAAGYSGPEAVTTAWINSAGHNKNMLNPEYGHAVVSMFVVLDDIFIGEISEMKESTHQHKYYYVQNFWE